MDLLVNTEKFQFAAATVESFHHASCDAPSFWHGTMPSWHLLTPSPISTPHKTRISSPSGLLGPWAASWRSAGQDLSSGVGLCCVLSISSVLLVSKARPAHAGHRPPAIAGRGDRRAQTARGDESRDSAAKWPATKRDATNGAPGLGTNGAIERYERSKAGRCSRWCEVL